MFLSVMVSTTDFDSVSLGSSPRGTTKNNNMKGVGDKIKSLVKFIDSRISSEYILIVAYLLILTTLVAWEVYTTK